MTPVRDKETRVEGLVLSLRDVTEGIHARQRIEALAAESQRRASELNAVLWQMPAGVVIAEALTGKVILGNQQMDQIMGRPAGEVTPIEEYGQLKGFHGDGRPYQADEWPLAQSFQTGEVVKNEEITLLHDDGSPVTVLVSGCLARRSISPCPPEVQSRAFRSAFPRWTCQIGSSAGC